MKDDLRFDRARVQMGKISGFGLLEISRQRRRTGVLEGTSHVCEHCQGAGRVRSVESAALALLRALDEASAKQKGRLIEARAATDVALYLLNEKRDALAATRSQPARPRARHRRRGPAPRRLRDQCRRGTCDEEEAAKRRSRSAARAPRRRARSRRRRRSRGSRAPKRKSKLKRPKRKKKPRRRRAEAPAATTTAQTRAAAAAAAAASAATVKAKPTPSGEARERTRAPRTSRATAPRRARRIRRRSPRRRRGRGRGAPRVTRSMAANGSISSAPT